MFRNGLGLKDLVNLKKWQDIQDSFSESLGITLRTIDLKANALTNVSGSNQFCSRIISSIPRRSKSYCNCILKQELKDRINIKKLTNIKCPFFLDAFIIPIKAFGTNIAAYMIAGPVVLNKRKEKSKYAKEAKKLKIKLDKLIDALVEINVFSYTRMRSINTLLSDIFSYMAQTGYHKKRLGEIAPAVMGVDPIFSRYHEEKILDAFLNTCTIALDADSGSVMTLDKNTNKLRIRVASKLPQDVVDSTNIKVGDSIAGLAAATAEPIILPKDEWRNGLSGKMKRKYIKSSMIVPFSKANDHNVYGVLNLNIVRKDKDFAEKDIAFVKELINLTSIALMSVEQK